jgi:hypothetical protein
MIDDISNLYSAKYLPTSQAISLKITDLSMTPDFELIVEMTVRQHRRLTVGHNEEHSDVPPWKHHALLSFFCREWAPVDRYGSRWDWYDYYIALPPTQQDHAGNWWMKRSKRDSKANQRLRQSAKACSKLCRTSTNTITSTSAPKTSFSWRRSNIRSDNLFLDVTGDVRVTGLHQLVDCVMAGVRRKRVYKFVGDPEWMAPEVLAQVCATVKIYWFNVGDNVWYVGRYLQFGHHCAGAVLRQDAFWRMARAKGSSTIFRIEIIPRFCWASCNLTVQSYKMKAKGRRQRHSCDSLSVASAAIPQKGTHRHYAKQSLMLCRPTAMELLDDAFIKSARGSSFAGVFGSPNKRASQILPGELSMKSLPETPVAGPSDATPEMKSRPATAQTFRSKYQKE